MPGRFRAGLLGGLGAVVTACAVAVGCQVPTSDGAVHLPQVSLNRPVSGSGQGARPDESQPAGCGAESREGQLKGRRLLKHGQRPDLPRELEKAHLPDYVIEPPDLLLINALRVIPKPPYHIQPGDALLVQYSGETFPGKPLGGVYVLEPDGVINLGPDYGGPISLVDLTLEQASKAIEAKLAKILKGAGVKAGVVSVSLAQSRGLQQIRGQHLVRPDGTVGLGTYGRVQVTGLTLEEAKAAIENHLAQFLVKPEVSVDVIGYNSKVAYVIINQSAGPEQVIRLPVYGSETVLDTIGQINGLPFNVSKKRIWLARPAPAGNGCDQVLPVDWKAITRGGSTATNYQVLPGDRIFVGADQLVLFDATLAKLLSPLERILGITLLGSTTIRAVQEISAPLGGTTGTTVR